MFNFKPKALKNKRGNGAVGTAIVILSSVVTGAIVLMSTVGVTNNIVKPKVNAKVDSMYATETADAGGSGGSGGSGEVIVEPSEDSLKRNDVIPEGGTYKSLYDGTLSAGQTIPEPGQFDLYTEGDYTYSFQNSGWAVYATSKTKTSYGKILLEIAGKPVNSMYGAFKGCSAMTSAPEIPSTVNDIMQAFAGCTSLTGSIEININPESFGACLAGTNITEITGSTTMKATLLATKNDTY